MSRSPAWEFLCTLVPSEQLKVSDPCDTSRRLRQSDRCVRYLWTVVGAWGCILSVTAWSAPPNDLTILNDLTQKLVVHSRDAFQRSLLSTSEHLEHLGVSFRLIQHQALQEAYDKTLRLYEARRLKPEQQEPIDPIYLRAALQPLYEQRIRHLELALQSLEGLRQPAAIGWQADLALLRLTLTQARLEWARLLGRSEVIPDLEQQEQRIALEHYWHRSLDNSLGYAASADLVRAVALLNVAPEFKRQLVQRSLVETWLWHRTGAEIGREDKLLERQLDLAWLELPRSDEHASSAVSREVWNQADRWADQLFERKRTWFRMHTIGLGDLTRAWLLREQLHEVARTVGWEIPQPVVEKHREGLTDMAVSAQQIADRQGRLAADVLLVELLVEAKKHEPAVSETTGSR